MTLADRPNTELRITKAPSPQPPHKRHVVPPRIEKLRGYAAARFANILHDPALIYATEFHNLNNTITYLAKTIFECGFPQHIESFLLATHSTLATTARYMKYGPDEHNVHPVQWTPAFQDSVGEKLRLQEAGTEAFCQKLEDVYPSLTPKQQDGISEFRKGVKFALESLKRLYAFFSHGKEVWVEVGIDEIEQRIRQTVSSNASTKKDIPLSITYQYIPGKKTFSLPESALDSIAELVTNACKYVRENARHSIQVKIMQDHNRVRIYVEDNGRGIPGDDLATIVRFSKRATDILAEAETHGMTGNGIGLTQVDMMAKRNGGKFAMASKVGEGTAAMLILPYRSSAIFPTNYSAPRFAHPTAA